MCKGTFSNDQQAAAGYNIAIKYEALATASACSIRPNHKVKYSLKSGCKRAGTETTLKHTVSSVINVCLPLSDTCCLDSTESIYASRAPCV